MRNVANSLTDYGVGSVICDVDAIRIFDEPNLAGHVENLKRDALVQWVNRLLPPHNGFPAYAKLFGQFVLG